MASDTARKLDRYIEELTKRLPPFAQTAMDQIIGVSPRLLALRCYFQTLAMAGGADRLREQWAWTQGKFDSSNRGQAMMGEANAVIRHFNADPQNHGHRLSTAKFHRTLEDQLTLWNRNQTVQNIGDHLRNLAIAELQRTVTIRETPPYLQTQHSVGGRNQCVMPPAVAVKQPVYPGLGPLKAPLYLQREPTSPSVQQTVVIPRNLLAYEELPTDPSSLDRFRNFLIRATLSATTNAPPGTSRHGRAAAVDFVIPDMNLSTGNADRWRSTQMAQRLEDAVSHAGAHFAGPLQVPDEPWHYNYNP